MDFETASELLADDYRRAIVETLHDDSPISRGRLTDRLAARGVHGDGGTESDRPDPATRYRIRVTLHHDHLPRLADAGLVEYDDELVAATPELDAFVEWLGLCDREREPTDDPAPNERLESTVEDDLRDQLVAFYA